MNIVRMSPELIEDSARIVCDSFRHEYELLFRIKAERLLPFLRMSLAKNESWVCVDGCVTKGVLVLAHPQHDGAGYRDIFNVLIRTIPVWSAAIASRFILTPRVKIKKALHIDQIAVADQHRSKGIGKLLLEFSSSRARELGLNKITLQVRADNPAMSLYKKDGFRIVASKRSFIYRSASGCDTAIFMVKDIVS
jgi:ribosomal protein S18 acetylase RimI-like enzyme